METLKELGQIDILQFFYVLLTLMVSITSIVVIVGTFSEKVLKKPFKWWNSIRRDHKLLEDTISELKKLSDKRNEDIKQSIAHDKEIKESLDNFAIEIKESISFMQNEIKQFYGNRIKDREQSLEIQKELKDSQKEISDSVITISKKIDRMKEDTDKRFIENEEKQNKKEQAKIKAEISNRYSIYHERQWLTNIEFEALEGLISTYESFGGLNSFVHSIVQKEMYTWKKIDDEEEKTNS
ncbi:MAG: hypothetical protein ACLRPZ_04145 [Coprococcus sp.]